ncbi:hypothetical protein LA080_007195 [Diaporthe eres]|nr:hypothetical protein LA080_007195 [Diaporthe eres]
MSAPVSPVSTLSPGSPAASWSSDCSSASTLVDNERDRDAESAALASAILVRDTERIQLLLDLGIALDGGDTIFHFILSTPRERFQDDKDDVVKLLLRTGACSFRRDRLGDTPLHLLAGDKSPYGSSTDGGRLLESLLNDLPEVRELCSSYINSKNNYGDTPLVVAVLYNNIECVQLLLDHGADPYEPGEYGMTALDFAVQREYAEITELLLTHMAGREAVHREAAENRAAGNGQMLE